MIKIRNLENNQQSFFSTTKFPDMTTQTYKIVPEPKKGEKYEITYIWNSSFLRAIGEGPQDIFAILQLAMLLYEMTDTKPALHLPYLPYARQDKAISNNTTFALHAFAAILNSGPFSKVTAIDAHSLKASMLIDNFENISPEPFIHYVIKKMSEKYEKIVAIFPDEGAKKRYQGLIDTSKVEIIYGKKERDLNTGEITGLSLEGNITSITGAGVAVIDDICDGGATFLELAKVINPFEPKIMALAVTHGLFSRGRDVLYDAGYREICTTNTLLSNDTEFPIVRDYRL